MCPFGTDNAHYKNTYLYNITELLAIVSRLNGTLIIDDGLIKSKTSKFKIQYCNAELYPVIDFNLDTDYVTIDSKELSNALLKTVYACSNDTGVLSGVYFNNDNVVATDGNRLVINKINDIGINTIMPKAFCEEVIRLFTDDIALIRVLNNKILISNDKIALMGNIIAGNYPKYEQLLPKDFKYEVKFKKSIFLESLNTLMPLFNDRFMICQLDINGCLVKMQGDNGNATGETELLFEESNIGEQLSICFNAHFLMDMLKNYDEDITMQFNSSLSPTVFTDKNGRYSLIMPIKK